MERTGKTKKAETSELHGIMHGEGVVYPFVVIHWMPGVYGRRRVIFRKEGDTCFDGRDFILAHPAAFDENGTFSKEAFMDLISTILATVKKYDRRMCLVISPTDSFYVEPDGALNRSSEPPAGGIEMDFDLDLQMSEDR